MTPLYLSNGDQKRLAAASEALLSPLAFPDADAWRRAVCDRVRAVLGPAKVGMVLPTLEGPNVFTEDFDPAIKRYPEEIQPVAQAFGMFDRLRRLGVADRQRAWGEHLDAYYRTAYWNEYLRPLGAYDSLTLSVPVGPAETLADHVQIGLNRPSPLCEPFGDRGVAIGRLLLPSLQAGTMAWLRLSAARHALATLMDTLPVGALVFDADGRELHRAPHAAHLLAANDEEGLATLAGQMALGLTRPRAAGTARGPLPLTVARKGRLILRATRLGPELSGLEGTVMVTVEAEGPGAFDPDAPAAAVTLRARYGMTAQQARVALLLAARRSTDEIAAALFISPHTVRRHVEQVLERMGVPRRADVEAAVRQTLE